MTHRVIIIIPTFWMDEEEAMFSRASHRFSAKNDARFSGWLGSGDSCVCRQSSLRNANILAVVLLFLLAHTKNVVNCTSFAVPQSLTMGGSF